MRSDRAAGWQIVCDEPAALIIALYVRDAAGLAPFLDDPLVPPLEPAPAAVSLHVIDRARIARQWQDWWATTLRTPTDLTGSLAPLEPLEPPGFHELGERPELRQLTAHLFDRAQRWANESELRRLSEQLRGARLELADVVAEVERDLGRPARPFRFRITGLPVAGRRAWPIDANHVVMTRNLLADPDNAADWLRPRLRGLA